MIFQQQAGRMMEDSPKSGYDQQIGDMWAQTQEHRYVSQIEIERAYQGRCA
jgi:hypothetical protein